MSAMTRLGELARQHQKNNEADYKLGSEYFKEAVASGEVPYLRGSNIRFFDGASWRPGVVKAVSFSLAAKNMIQWEIQRVSVRTGKEDRSFRQFINDVNLLKAR